MFVFLLLVSFAHAARFLLLGDAGQSAVERARERVDGVLPPCGPDERGEDCELAAMMEHARARVARQPVDAVLALGDNYYGTLWWVEPAPTCRGPGPDATDRDRRRLADVVKRYDALYGLFTGLPILGVLGNHDVGHGSWFRWRQRRTCSEAAMEAAGWNGDDTAGGIGTRRFGEGLVRLLDTNRQNTRAEADNEDALAPRGDAAWELWAGHHAWSLKHEKRNEPLHLRERMAEWKVHPDGLVPTIWVNGHAHHQEATRKDGVLAITSGSGSKQRKLKSKRKDPPDETFYVDPCRGYSILEVGGKPVTVRVEAYDYTDTVVGQLSCTWSDNAWQCEGEDPRTGPVPERCCSQPRP